MPLSEMTMTKRQFLAGVAATAIVAPLISAFPAFAQQAEMPQSDGDVDMAAVLKPGALPEMALGQEDAKVQIVEYMSMTCPHCAHFHNTTFDEI